jgi:hypothetical protein
MEAVADELELDDVYATERELFYVAWLSDLKVKGANFSPGRRSRHVSHQEPAKHGLDADANMRLRQTRLEARALQINPMFPRIANVTAEIEASMCPAWWIA